MSEIECPISYHASENPSALALICGKQQITYKQADLYIEGIIDSLKIKPLTTVSFYPTHSPITPLLFFALFRIGAIAFPLNPNLPSTTATLDIEQIKLTAGKQKTRIFSLNTMATHLTTSGSTGKPKIACHSLGNHIYSAYGSNEKMPIHLGDRYLLSLPCFHIAGIAILFRTFLAGGCVVMGSEIDHSITHLSLVPTQLYRYLNTEPFDHNLKHILLGGAHIDEKLFNAGIERGLPLHPTYGMTEMSSQITTSFDKTYSMGHLLPHRELKIEKSEILVRGKTLFQGYLNEPKTSGWFRTGDLGTYCQKKGLTVHGRKDRMFISGGENIQPEEIEKILMNHPKIDIAYVKPIEDAEFGKRPVAHISPYIPLEELLPYLKNHLPRYKIPVQVKLIT